MTEVRYSTVEEKKEIEELARSLKEVKDFVYNWERWKNWDKHPPIVATEGFYEEKKIIGFHAATFSDNTKYVNLYYQAVSLQNQRMGISKKIMDFLLSCAFYGGMERLKVKNHFDSPGEHFWRSLGAKPFAYTGKENMFDMDISGISNLSDLSERLMNFESIVPVETLEQYKKRNKGMVLL